MDPILKKEGINEMRKKRWQKALWPVSIAANIVLVVLLLVSAKPKMATTTIEKTKFEAVEVPDKVSFAGEPMPLDRFYVKEALDRELLSNAYFHSQTIRYIKQAPRYLPTITRILKEEGIPEDFKYLAVAESGFNPRAVSPAQARGFWQFLKGTAIDYGLEVNSEIDERYHIEKSTRAACNYLKNAYEKFGNWTMVAAAYNRGLTGVQRQVERQKEDDYYDLLITTETARYVYRIVALKLILENPEKYNFFIPEEEKYPIIPTKKVEITGSVASFADFAEKQGVSYKVLKDFNPWLRENKLTYSGRKRYWVEIPE
jgi:hypothetical protein